MFRSLRRHSDRPNRRGTILPAAVLAMLTAMLCVALVLDRLWLEGASVELTVAAEAGALAAAKELAGDDLLRDETHSPRRIARAKRAAARVIAANPIAGRPAELDLSSEGDVRFGRLVENTETGLVRFLETGHDPTSVVVAAHRTRSRGNPVALFFRGLTGQPAGDVVERAEATIDNRVVGVRPFGGVPVPALPLAILKEDPSGQAQSWDLQIGQKLGQDCFSYDPRTGKVRRKPDGIPEIVLRSMKPAAAPEERRDISVQLIDVGTELRTDLLTAQIRRGWTAEDLERFEGELTFSPSRPLTAIGAAAVIPRDVSPALEQVIGECRVCVLYTTCDPVGRFGLGQIHAVGLVAGRIMSVRRLPDGICEIVFQPAVLTTRTALLAHDCTPGGNPYIYKLHLTR